MAVFMVVLLLADLAWAGPSSASLEKRIRKYIATDAFSRFHADQRCHGRDRYRVYLIDNFEQGIDLVPEVRTSHGHLLAKLLRAGREDIEIRILNTSLSKGLALVIQDLAAGGCADAVVSSVPGSNYTYDQISSLLAWRHTVSPQNILYHRSALRQLLRRIAHRGFPSVAWLQGIDVNSVKLRNDARKFVYIEALGRFSVPVILPYGNADARHKGQIKAVNLLSLAANARVYSALDRQGARVADYPYSPLSSGDATAVYPIVECPHPVDPFKAVLDINDDGLGDYTFFRVGRIAYHDSRGQLAFAPPVVRQDVFVRRLARWTRPPACRVDEEVVLTAAQYRQLQARCPEVFTLAIAKPYAWLNTPAGERLLAFEPACWARGRVSGTSVIPPAKLRELLPPKRARAPALTQEPRSTAADG
jgi:hypothetical protein